MGRGRLTLAFILLLGVLVAAPRAGAQAPGSELSEAVTSDAVGDDAYVALSSVEAFPADGGEAVFEPGTDYEEVFTYTAADPDTNRLVGLTRSTPTSHAAGAFVQAPPVETAEPETSPAPDETAADSAEPGEQEPESTESTTSSGSPDDASQAPPPICEPLAEGKTCGEVAEDLLAATPGAPPAETICDALTSACDEIEDVLEGHTPDLCSIVVGKTCGEVLQELLAADTPGCIGELCHIIDDPLGPWSVCDVDNTDAECPDPEDVIDLVWNIDNPLFDLRCEAGVSGPELTEGGGMAKGRGWIDCGEAVVLAKVWVCLHKNQEGVWIRMGCRTNPSYNDTDGYAARKVVEPCAQKQTLKYRIRARGEGWDGGRPPDQVEWDGDSAKATATFYCPGPASSAAASQDALEYANSWLPDSE